MIERNAKVRREDSKGAINHMELCHSQTTLGELIVAELVGWLAMLLKTDMLSKQVK